MGRVTTPLNVGRRNYFPQLGRIPLSIAFCWVERRTNTRHTKETNGRIPKELIERIYRETGYNQTAVSMR